MKEVLILCGGASSEHEISLISKDYLVDQLNLIQEVKTSVIVFPKDGSIPNNFELNAYDYIIPCFHGYPGETGDIQSLFELYKKPFLGARAEASRSCFNKVTTKLYCQKLGIPTLDFVLINSNSDTCLKDAEDFFSNNSSGLFIKSARQGSSVGCAMAKVLADIPAAIKTALDHDTIAIAEPLVKARELEVSAFEYKGELHITKPGEVTPPDNDFYSYEEKYSESSHSTTKVEANLSEQKIKEIQDYAMKLFINLELKDHCRMDFFFDEKENIYLNEINTFPGLTPISMFPKMMENYGVLFSDYLKDKILSK